MRGDDDHQFRLVALVRGRAEEGAQNRHIAQPRKLRVAVGKVVLQQSRNGKAFAVAHFDRGRGFATGEGVDLEAVDRKAVGRVNRRYGSFKFEVDQILVHHAGDKVQLDAEGFVFDGDCAAILADRNGIFATGEKFRLLARKRHEVRFGQRAHNTFGFKGFQKDANLGRACVKAEQNSARIGVCPRNAAAQRIGDAAGCVGCARAAVDAQITAQRGAVQRQRRAERF